MKSTLDKPKTFGTNLARLPAALAPLTKQKRWVNWSWEWRGTKWDKPPKKSSNQRNAATDNPKTWSSYADAVKAVKAGNADGIGYVLTDSDVAAEDLDNCRDPGSGKLAPWAEEMVAEARAAGAYVETTVSGTGLRIIGTAANGADFNTKLHLDGGGSIELYRRATRYITISGLAIGKCRKLPNIDELLERTYQRHTGKSKSSHGKFSSHYPPLEDWEIDAALAATPADDYWVWFYNGCALAKKYGDDGFARWDKWSATSKKYDARQCKIKWEKGCKKVASYTEGTAAGYNDGTIVYHANEASPGWRGATKSNTKQEAAPTEIHATPFAWIDPTKIPLREWLYYPHYIRKFASLTVAHSKIGKSAKVIVELLAMVVNKALLGVQPQSKLRVWYWNGEDPLDELQRRIMAAVKYYDLTEKEISSRLFVDSGRTMPIVIAEADKNGTRIAVPVIEGVIKTLLENQIDVLIIDPFVASHRIPENDNSGIERVAKNWAHIAEVANCAVMLVHHSRKTYGEDVTSSDSRGASALVAAVRAVQTLNTMTKKEAEDLGIEESTRRRYFRSDGGESNMAPPATRADWFCLESVSLDNAVAIGFGDQVGVVTRWVPPEDAQPRVSTEGIRSIQAALKAGGPWREDRRSKVELWAGETFAEALSLDLTRKNVTDWISKGLRALTKAGYLNRVTKRDQHRTLRIYIEAGKEPEKGVEILF